MIIKKLIIKQGMFEKLLEFSSHTNFIFSEKNSAGKTTLIRTILYAIGYSIPSTKKLDFGELSFETHILTGDSKYILYRKNSYFSINDGNEEKVFSLPSDFYEIMHIIFKCEEKYVLDNLLGAYYLDQEKGWTLLNRGKVIGNIPFKIEDLILGLGKKNCDEINNQLNMIEYQIKKYEHMQTVSKYQQELEGEAIYDESEEELNCAIELLYMKQENLSKELKQIKDILNKNKILVDFITDMKLIVLNNDEEIIVTKENLVGYNDNLEYLTAQREVLSSEIAVVNRDIKLLESKRKKENELFKLKEIVEEFDSNIKKINIDHAAVSAILKDLNKEKKRLKDIKNEMIKQDHEIVTLLHSLIRKYATELGIDEEIIKENENYVFTSDLKSLSGTILHLIVYSFKLSYIKMIRERTGIVCPIILDSPTGREVKREKVEQMLQILQRDFGDHQIFIASIYEFDIDIDNKIVIDNKLLDF